MTIFVVQFIVINRKEVYVARPIKETPVITGKDAKAFALKMKKSQPISKEESDKACKIYKEFKSIAKFTL